MDCINGLISALNDGRNEKECYKLLFITQYKSYYLVAAVNNDGVVHNIVDETGAIPEGFEVNWRALSLIAHDLGLTTIPEEVLYHFVTSINHELLMKDKNTDLDAFWKDVILENLKNDY